MGVSGCGKTTVGKGLAQALFIPFYDADDFHPTANIEKMKRGIPLDDSDRSPWLEHLSKAMVTWEKDGGAVLACSALKEAYRKTLSKKTAVTWVWLTADFETIYQRMKQRNHFMKPEMLQSQLDTLEAPSYGIHVDASQNVDTIVSEIEKQLAHE